MSPSMRLSQVTGQHEGEDIKRLRARRCCGKSKLRAEDRQPGEAVESRNAGGRRPSPPPSLPSPRLRGRVGRGVITNDCTTRSRRRARANGRGRTCSPSRPAARQGGGNRHRPLARTPGAARARHRARKVEPRKVRAARALPCALPRPRRAGLTGAGAFRTTRFRALFSSPGSYEVVPHENIRKIFRPGW